ncbi:uncharacterized protein LOC117171060 [Belonocnema kinseyi]|uniref:uncharacterized protein LOC117171060 n=1 Tax=Belonocnema kinseyi TaxID=2817044 RepID=UPI00143D94CA|nr:uncharacterized protein LOC117171060 [Belonocnema kinseyi]
MEGDNPGSESSVDSMVEMTNKKRKKSSSRKGREKVFNSTINNIKSEEFEEQDLPTVTKISSLKNKSSQLQNPSFQEHKNGHSSTQISITEAQTTPKPRSGSHHIAPYKPREARQNQDLGYITVLKEIKSLRMDVQRLAEGLKEMKKIMEIDRSEIYIGKKSFEEEYNLKLPLNSLEDFKLLDREHKNNEECCCRFKASVDLSMSLDAGLRKSLNIILKTYLGRDLILKLTVVKKVQARKCSRILSSTHACMLLLLPNLLLRKRKWIRTLEPFSAMRKIGVEIAKQDVVYVKEDSLLIIHAKFHLDR